MQGEMIVKQWLFWRNYTIDFVQDLNEVELDVTPINFDNTIRWNIGHILVGWDEVVAVNLDRERILPDKFQVMFGNGTSPQDWEEEPPSHEKLLFLLNQQTEDLGSIINDYSDHPLKAPFANMQTVGEVCQFLTSQETLHLGKMNAMKLIIQGNEND
ncbi:DinB family protein [Halalkalibacillus halophilus]|uniref:DinB family protein n=1 Tax=Halalkalibacillus halophilus TaxID=392827 RepID=UPI0003FA185C|nr:DinB family protein [Halalkalibacillus halophilus]